MIATDLIRRLDRHQRWANARLLVAAQTMPAEALHQPFPIGQGNLFKTVVHLYAAEFVWLEAILGNLTPMSPFDIHFDNLPALQEAWRQLDTRWAAFYANLTDAELDRPVRKTRTSSLAGQTFTNSLADVLLHMFTHAQYTSAQAKIMLRQSGMQELPDVMLITQSRRGE